MTSSEFFAGMFNLRNHEFLYPPITASFLPVLLCVIIRVSVDYDLAIDLVSIMV